MKKNKKKVEKKTENNKYGYKVCYREKKSQRYVTYFIDYTYKDALISKKYYVTYPTYKRDSHQLLVNVEWKIIPITKEEVKKGIWRDVPF